LVFSSVHSFAALPRAEQWDLEVRVVVVLLPLSERFAADFAAKVVDDFCWRCSLPGEDTFAIAHLTLFYQGDKTICAMFTTKIVQDVVVEQFEDFIVITMAAYGAAD